MLSIIDNQDNFIINLFVVFYLVYPQEYLLPAKASPMCKNIIPLNFVCSDSCMARRIIFQKAQSYISMVFGLVSQIPHLLVVQKVRVHAATVSAHAYPPI